MLIAEVENLNPNPTEKVLTWLQSAEEQLHNLNPLAAGIDEFIEKFEFRESPFKNDKLDFSLYPTYRY